METRETGLSPTLDYLLYIILCIFSFGAVWFIRIIITMAIRHAFKNGK